MRTDISNPVIHAVRPGTPVIPGSVQQAQIRVSGTANHGPGVHVVRTNPPQAQSHVVLRPSVATTMANSSSSVQVVNASSAGTPSTLRPGVNTQQLRPNQIRVTNPVRIASQPQIAPRQPSQPVSVLNPQFS